MNDFRDLSGIASLTGFLLMKGGKKYSSTYNLKEYVQNHHGHVQMFPKTKAAEQIFSFDVKYPFLAPALRR